MGLRSRHRRDGSCAVRCAGESRNAPLVAVALIMGALAGSVDAAEPLAVPARWLRTLDLPGQVDALGRPAAIHVDRRHGEILVADARSNRVAFFDLEGNYRFEFDCTSEMSQPADLTVDGEGFVWVLGSSAEGPQLVRYDFDGVLVSSNPLSPLGLRAARALVGERDRLYLMTSDARIEVLDLSRQSLASFDFASALGEAGVEQGVLGHPAVWAGRIYVPVASQGTVLVIDASNGDVLRSIGSQGNQPGQLMFPVAAAIGERGLLLVLDKSRFTVACFDPRGGFVGEFGGKGYRDGWFYHPTLLAADDTGHAIVGQILDHRIQLCAIPREFFGRGRFGGRLQLPEEGDEEAVSGPGADEGRVPLHPQSGSVRSRGGSASSQEKMVVGESPSLRGPKGSAVSGESVNVR